MSIGTLKGREAPKNARSTMETLLFHRDEINNWKIPPFQRPVRVNDKVRALSAELGENGGVISGTITIGRLEGDSAYYIVDGQHRIEAFRITDLMECIADIRMVNFESMGEMAEEFVNLNTALVKMRPDDILRGLESSTPALEKIRQGCDFVSYGSVRRGDSKSPLVSMSALLRCWHGSTGEMPAVGSKSATALANDIDPNETDKLIVFMQAMREAWGTDPENYRLWSNLNLTMTMWMWRKLVIDRERGVKRYAVLSITDFKKCVMAVSADFSYLDWLIGRNMNERDRSPCYTRLKAIFIRRLQKEDGPKVLMPAPEWASK